MKQIRLSYLFLTITLVTVLTSCHKDKVVSPNATPAGALAGLYILNQGFNGPNSTLTYYDFTTKALIPDQFSVVNGQGLGNNANDIEIYGSKMYITVDKSGIVDVVDPKTAKLIKQVIFQNPDLSSMEPRSIAFYKGSAYVTLYSGNVAVMDTATFTVSKYIPVGRDPEQLVVANNKLYVANSGGLDFPNYDNTVSIIDLSSLTVTKTLTVVINPQIITADANGNVYVISSGNYGSIPSNLAIIDDNADLIKSQSNFDATAFTVQGDNAYFITSAGNVGVYSTKTQTITASNFITDGTKITSPYTLTANAITGEVFVTDAVDYTSNGLLYAFDKTGKKEYSFTVGINPGKIALLNK